MIRFLDLRKLLNESHFPVRPHDHVIFTGLDTGTDIDDLRFSEGN